MPVYHPRAPTDSALWKILHNHYEDFGEHCEKQYGFLRPVVDEVVEEYLRCGDLHEACPELVEGDLPGCAAPTPSAKMSSFWRSRVRGAGFAPVAIRKKRFSSERTSPTTSYIQSRTTNLCLPDGEQIDRDGKTWRVDFNTSETHLVRVLTFIESSIFERELPLYLDVAEYAELQQLLMEDPEAGSLVPGFDGVRKIRWKRLGMAKRGSFRLIYFVRCDLNEICMLTIYANVRSGNIPANLLRALKGRLENEP